MAINDIFASLLAFVGLKKSDLKKCEEAIAAHDELIRDLYDELSLRNGEVEALEGRIRKLKAKYTAASPVVRDLLVPQIRSLLQDFAHLKELQSLLLRNIDKEKLMRQARMIERENLVHPPNPDDVEDSIEAKTEALADIGEEDREIAKLATVSYAHESPAINVVASVQSDAAKERDEALLRDIDSILGEETDKKPSSDVSEQETQIA